ncbi:MAG: fumarate hydratase [Bacillota bacterium]
MKKITAEQITEAVAELCQEANFFLNEDLIESLKKGKKEESSALGQDIFQQLIKNQKLAAKKQIPVCQDTGFVVVFAEIGNQVLIEGNFEEAINQGVKKGYREGYLRNSIVKDPLKRVNTGDNTPAVVHTELVTGDKLVLKIAAKGGGSENMSRIKMLSPGDGKQGIIDFVVDTVRKADANPCPPIIVGVGLGGTFEKAAILSKKALLRDLGDQHPDPDTAELEKTLLKKINQLGIGPQGLGGEITALGVKIEKYPCHIASLPVAVNINCHASRHKEIIL